MTVRGGGGGLHHTMAAPKLQQFQYNLKRNFQHLWRLFPMLFGAIDGCSNEVGEGGIAMGGGGGGLQWGGGGAYIARRGRF